jgi:hypothetical protein
VQRLESEMVKLKEKILGQPTQDNRDHMVNELDVGTIITRSSSQQKYKSPLHNKQEKLKKDLKHIKCFMRSDMGHYAFTCSAQIEGKTILKKANKATEDHHMLWMQERSYKIQACPNSQIELHCSEKTSQTDIHKRSNQSSSSLFSQVKMKTSSNGPITTRTRQSLQEACQRQ